ncbi:MAG TPA: FHA domain-containing protein, partial [Gemmataceae bacterium]|nr:FHA domain-containing protein [Gemmataceae bacterium]
FSIRNVDGASSGGAPSRPLANPLLTVPAERDALPPATFAFLEGAPSEGVQWRMRQSLALVGKSSRCRVQLGGAGVLPFHGALVRTQQGVWFVDFGERTWVNGVAVRLAQLQDGDLLQIGKYAMRLTYERAIGNAAPERPRALGSNVIPPQKRLPAPPAGDRARDLDEQELVPDTTSAAPPWPVTGDQGAAVADAASFPVAESRQGADRNLPAVSDHLALQVLRQCGMMQQQMAEQHQQVMSFLCQFLTSFRKESQEAILEEIREFRRATLELQALQARLAAPAVTTAAPVAEPAPAQGEARPAPTTATQVLEALETRLAMPDAPEQLSGNLAPAQMDRPPALARLKQELQALEAQLTILTTAAPEPLAVSPALAQADRPSLPNAGRQVAEARTPTKSDESLSSTATDLAGGKPATEQVDDQPVSAQPETDDSLEAKGTAETVRRPQAEPDPELIHAQLMSRMAALQNEQQTRLQKILRFVRSNLLGDG